MTVTRLAIVGSRTFHDAELFQRVTAKVRERFPEINTIISGGCPTGADHMAAKYARDDPVLVLKEFKADWEKHGRSAGPIRNKLIAAECDAVLAFWDGRSPGTKNTLKISKKYGKPCIVVRTDKPGLVLGLE